MSETSETNPVQPAIPLREMLRQLRAELTASMEEAKGEDIRFRLEKVDLELKVEVSTKLEGHAGVEFWVVSLGGKGEQSTASTHVFKITLTPVSKANGELLVADTAQKSSLGGGQSSPPAGQQ